MPIPRSRRPWLVAGIAIGLLGGLAAGLLYTLVYPGVAPFIGPDLGPVNLYVANPVICGLIVALFAVVAIAAAFRLDRRGGRPV